MGCLYLTLKTKSRDFPGGPVGKTPHFLVWGRGMGHRFNLWSGN